MSTASHIFRLFSIAALSGLTMASSCKKPEIKPTDTAKPKGITLDFRGMFGTTALAYKTGEYTRSNGEILQVTNWAMILSKVSLVKTDDSKVLLGDGYLFVDFVGQKTNFNFPNVPEGDYKAISFELGLDTALNHGDPTLWPANHPLNANYTGLHWGWATGYIFQALDGRYKKQASDVNWTGLSLHTATDSFTRSHVMPLLFTLEKDGHKTAKIELNVDEFFKNPTLITFATDGSFSHSIGNAEIALMKLVMANSDDVYNLVEVK